MPLENGMDSKAGKAIALPAFFCLHEAEVIMQTRGKISLDCLALGINFSQALTFRKNLLFSLRPRRHGPFFQTLG